MRIAGIMLLLLVALQGCGRKGPLLLPPAHAEAQTAPDQSAQKK
ncbi:MAG TPA: lipoprotein [Sideroxyarcus sp.]|nr:lipoprotein [Sideroxyarcus sp.]